jgi:TonB family protein
MATTIVGSSRKHFFISLILHILVVAALIISFEFSTPALSVEHNQNTTEIINATAMSENTPNPNVPTQAAPSVAKITKPVLTPPPKVTPQQVTPPTPKEIVIPDKKQQQLVKEKMAAEMLQDLKKQTHKQKQAKLKALTADFQQEMKTLTKKTNTQPASKIAATKITAKHAQALSGEVDKFKGLILQSISQHWIVPGNPDKKLSAKLLIRLAPGGMVLAVDIIKSSGDEALDRSARTAVFQASPLPVPTDAESFEPFRQFELKVKPENILRSDSWVS